MPAKKKRKTKKNEEPEPVPEVVLDFPSPFSQDYSGGYEARPMIEIAILKAIQQIRKKNDWEKKINSEVGKKWRKELKGFDHQQKSKKNLRKPPKGSSKKEETPKDEPKVVDEDALVEDEENHTPRSYFYRQRTTELNDDAIKYVFDELKYISDLTKGKSLVPSVVDGVWQSDSLIPDELRTKLIKGVAILENLKPEERDYHPGSNDQVLDLVHPSLFCFVHGVSRETKTQLKPSLLNIGAGKIKTEKKEKLAPRKVEKHYYFDSYYSMDEQSKSERYQWLPSEFIVDSNGKVKIDSYINNLHPVKHKELYGTIASIFEKFCTFV